MTMMAFENEMANEVTLLEQHIDNAIGINK
jgi:hypothetical protein